MDTSLQANLIGSVYCQTIKEIFSSQASKLRSLKQAWINAQTVSEWAAAIFDNGYPLRNIAGFLDGKCLCTCRPSWDQNEQYCGHHHRQAEILFEIV